MRTRDATSAPAFRPAGRVKAKLPPRLASTAPRNLAPGSSSLPESCNAFGVGEIRGWLPARLSVFEENGAGGVTLPRT